MNIHPNKKGFTLTKNDFVIEWFSGTGAGGSNRNKTQNCCRLKHLESGCCELGTEERSREQNQKHAFNKLGKSPRFKSWCDSKLREIETGKTIGDLVDEEMKAENLKYEIIVDGKWKEVKPEEIELK